MQDLFEEGLTDGEDAHVDGVDKFKTLRHIKDGYARDRINLFEALM